MGLSVQDSTLVDRRASPSAENHVVTKMGPGLHKASIQLEVPGTSCCLVLSRLKGFGVDLESCFGPHPALVPRTISVPEAKMFSII